MKPDGVSRNAPYGNGFAKLQEALKVGVGILVRLAAKQASLYQVYEAGFQLEVYIPNIDVGSSHHIGGGGDGKVTESLLSHGFG